MSSFHPQSESSGSQQPESSGDSVPLAARHSACAHCRIRKIKCDSLTPSCSNCKAIKIPCEYDGVDKRRKGGWKATVDRLERKNAELEKRILELSNRTTPDTQQPFESSNDGLDFLQANQELGGHGASPTIPLEPGIENNSSVTLSDWNYDWLPSQEITHSAVSLFYNCTTSLFYTCTTSLFYTYTTTLLYTRPFEVLNSLIEKLYHDTSRLTKGDAIEIFAIAAIGCQYRNDDKWDTIKQQFHRHASLLVPEVMHTDMILSIRIFIYLSMFSIMAKSVAVRGFTASGLTLTRCYLRVQMQNNSIQLDPLEINEIIRTLSFLECWMSFTLGYSYNLTPTEIELANEISFSEQFLDEHLVMPKKIQVQMSKICYVSAKLNIEMKRMPSLSWEDVVGLSSQLERWYQELPRDLHLQTLISTPSSHKQPLLLVHMIYVEARLLPYANMITRPLKSGEAAHFSEIFLHMPEQAQLECHIFSQQLARIISLYPEKSIPARCWALIHASFYSTVMLLLHISRGWVQNPGDRNQTHALDFGYVDSCLNVLEFCSQVDVVAANLLDRLTKSYTKLKVIATEYSISSKAQLSNQMPADVHNQHENQPRETKVLQIMTELLRILATPGYMFWV